MGEIALTLTLKPEKPNSGPSSPHASCLMQGERTSSLGASPPHLQSRGAIRLMQFSV